MTSKVAEFRLNAKKQITWTSDTRDDVINNNKRDVLTVSSKHGLSMERPKPTAAIRDDDWKSLQNSITYLFHKKKLQRLELDVLNEKVRNVRDSKIGSFIVEYYKDSILKKGMIVLRENIKEKKGNDLLERLSEVWSQFYTSILPTLLAIFYPIQEQGIYIRAVTLVGFRDIVLLKTKISDALVAGEKVNNEIKQMLLVLASIHDTNPPSENYMKLEKLVARVVRPYLGFDGLYTKTKSPTIKRMTEEGKGSNAPVKERKVSRSQLFKEEMRKFRRSSSNTSNSDNQHDKDGGLKSRFRLGSSPSVSRSVSVSESSGSVKSNVDTDMLNYLNVRENKWRQREELLVSESLL